MFDEPTPAAPPTPPLLTRALAAMCAVARSLLARLAEPQAAMPDPAPLPKPLAGNPKTAESRIARTLAWLAALTEILTGGRHYHRPTPMTVAGLLTSLAPMLVPEPAPAAPRARGAAKPRTAPQRDAARAAARLNYMRRVFATVPTATIATRLARRLGLTAASPEWPHDLIAITEPPAIWANKLHPPPETLPGVGVLVRAVRRFVAAVAIEIGTYQLE